MAICHHCGQIQPEKAQRGELLITREPHAIYWRGVRRPMVSPSQHALLFLFAKRGEITSLALEMVSEKSSGSLKVHISRLRKWFIEQDMPLAIKNIRDFGYRLEFLSDQEG